MMEIGDYGIKCAEDIEEAINEHYPNWDDASEVLMVMCRVHGERFFGMLCEFAAKKHYGISLDPFTKPEGHDPTGKGETK